MCVSSSTLLTHTPPQTHQQILGPDDIYPKNMVKSSDLKKTGVICVGVLSLNSLP